MDARPNSTVDYERLFQIAYRTAFSLISTSARYNVADQIAGDTLEEYLRADAAGEEIRNPYGWIRVRAGWRALDEARRWQRRKLRTRPMQPFEADEGEDREFADLLEWVVGSSGERFDFGDPEVFVVGKEWVRELIEAAYPEDSTNRRLAIACLVEGARPREVADEFGMDAKVIGNRLVRIRAKLREVLEQTTQHIE
jgi:DNA-directed RNA polymerase specialized sigma24 family protein